MLKSDKEQVFEMSSSVNCLLKIWTRDFRASDDEGGHGFSTFFVGVN